MRIITQEEHLRKLRELFRPLEVKAQLYKFFEAQGCTTNDVLVTDLSVIVAPHKISKECHLFRSRLVDAGRTLLFMVEQILLLMGDVWFLPNADTRRSVQGERRPKGTENLCVFFF